MFSEKKPPPGGFSLNIIRYSVSYFLLSIIANATFAGTTS